MIDLMTRNTFLGRSYLQQRRSSLDRVAVSRSIVPILGLISKPETAQAGDGVVVPTSRTVTGGQHYTGGFQSIKVNRVFTLWRYRRKNMRKFFKVLHLFATNRLSDLVIKLRNG